MDQMDMYRAFRRSQIPFRLPEKAACTSVFLTVRVLHPVGVTIVATARGRGTVAGNDRRVDH
jgi:hypothetical protein